MFSSIDPVRLAYAAGLLDGEGCITIKRSAPAHRRKTPTYVISICIEMADPRPIHAFCQIFGFTVHFNNSRNLKNPLTHRKLYVAQIGSYRGVAMLRALLPFLVAKREEAETAIEYFDRCIAPNTPRLGRRGRPTPLAALEERHSYYLKLQELKRRRFQ